MCDDEITHPWFLLGSILLGLLVCLTLLGLVVSSVSVLGLMSSAGTVLAGTNVVAFVRGLEIT